MPASTAYICRVRTDIPAGALQWVDLYPNSSLRNPTIQTAGQTGYLADRVENDTLAALSANATVATYKGLAAYLIDNVIDSGGATITVGRANTTAVALIARLDAGSTITVTNINAALVAAGCTAGTTLTTGGSTGTVTDVLKILAGGKYTLPSGSVVGGLAAGAQLGSFDDTYWRPIYISGALQASCDAGNLSVFASNTFGYGGTTGRALVVYDTSGNVIT